MKNKNMINYTNFDEQKTDYSELLYTYYFKIEMLKLARGIANANPKQNSNENPQVSNAELIQQYMQDNEPGDPVQKIIETSLQDEKALTNKAEKIENFLGNEDALHIKIAAIKMAKKIKHYITAANNPFTLPKTQSHFSCLRTLKIIAAHVNQTNTSNILGKIAFYRTPFTVGNTNALCTQSEVMINQTNGWCDDDKIKVSNSLHKVAEQKRLATYANGKTVKALA